MRTCAIVIMSSNSLIVNLAHKLHLRHHYTRNIGLASRWGVRSMTACSTWERWTGPCTARYHGSECSDWLKSAEVTFLTHRPLSVPVGRNEYPGVRTALDEAR